MSFAAFSRRPWWDDAAFVAPAQATSPPASDEAGGGQAQATSPPASDEAGGGQQVAALGAFHDHVLRLLRPRVDALTLAVADEDPEHIPFRDCER